MKKKMELHENCKMNHHQYIVDQSFMIEIGVTTTITMTSTTTSTKTTPKTVTTLDPNDWLHFSRQSYCSDHSRAPFHTLKLPTGCDKFSNTQSFDAKQTCVPVCFGLKCRDEKCPTELSNFLFKPDPLDRLERPSSNVKIEIKIVCENSKHLQMEFLINNDEQQQPANNKFNSIAQSIKSMLVNLASNMTNETKTESNSSNSTDDGDGIKQPNTMITPNHDDGQKCQQLDGESNFDWPNSFIRLLDSLATKQQQQQQHLCSPTSSAYSTDSLQMKLFKLDANCDPKQNLLLSSHQSIASLTIDDRDLELLCGLRNDENYNHLSPFSNKQPYWLMDFELSPLCRAKNDETIQPIDLMLPSNDDKIVMKTENADRPANNQTDGNKNDRNIINLMQFLCYENKNHNNHNSLPTELDNGKQKISLKQQQYTDKHGELKRCKTLPIRFDRITSINLDQLKQPLSNFHPGTIAPTNGSIFTEKTLESIENKQDFDDEEDEEQQSGDSDFAREKNDRSNPRGSREASLDRQAEPSGKQAEAMQHQVKLVSGKGDKSAQGKESGPQDLPSDKQRQQQKQQLSKDDDGRYSMLQFALYNFREALDKYSMLQHQQAGDTSTLRGSLKLIESLRNGSAVDSDQQHNVTLGTNQMSSSATFSSTGYNGLSGTLKSNSSASNADWTWRELAEMVKFTAKPLKRSLLRLPNQDDLERRALDCFAAIMQYMGDLKGQSTKSSVAPASEVECVYLILINCHNYPILRDEVYCQLMKQTTNNRQQVSMAATGNNNGGNVDSCLRGWRLFSIVAAYFDCSPKLKPYLVKYLEQAAFDKRRAYHSVAMLCLQNLRKTFKYKGRKNVPSIEEIAATSAGRNSKRQIYRLPGGTERVINTKSSTVVEDIIQEICSNMLGVDDQDEMLEFSLYCIADGDLYTMPLNRDEYILDITTELIKNHQQYFLIFCRSIWHYPLRLDNKLYIEVTFNQIAPDYLEGLLLILPSEYGANSDKRHSISHGQRTIQPSEKRHRQLSLKAKLVNEIARIAALLHRASGTDYMPHKDEIKYLLPKPIVSAIKYQQREAKKATNVANDPSSYFNTTSSSSASSTSSQSIARNATTQQKEQSASRTSGLITPTAQDWVQLVQNYWKEMSAFDTLDAKAQFLDLVRNWPLFGSSFFAIKLIQRDLIQPTDYILALNKFGIQMLDTITHETVHKYPFAEVVSTRKVRSEDGALFLDMKCGNLMRRTIIRIQTDQAHEISRLIRQYIDIVLVQSNKPELATKANLPSEVSTDIGIKETDEQIENNNTTTVKLVD